MDDRRDPPAEPGSHPSIAGATLPTAQQAHLDYNRHIEGGDGVRGCQRCSDVDRDRCAEGDRLWEAWDKAIGEAYRQLHPGRP